MLRSNSSSDAAVGKGAGALQHEAHAKLRLDSLRCYQLESWDEKEEIHALLRMRKGPEIDTSKENHANQKQMSSSASVVSQLCDFAKGSSIGHRSPVAAFTAA